MFGWEEKSSYYGSLFVMIVCIIYIILAVDKQNSANIPIILRAPLKTYEKRYNRLKIS